MANPIPDFDHNLVLPPHLGDPVDRSQLSPYRCTTVDLCQKLGTSQERREILSRFLDFRDHLRSAGLADRAFQWLDGSFLEDIETREGRAPRDMDVVTLFWGYDTIAQDRISQTLPEFENPQLAKLNYKLDHYPFDAGFDPAFTVEYSRYWILLFSHNRLGIWKGMLQIDLNTPAEDVAARQELATLMP